MQSSHAIHETRALVVEFISRHTHQHSPEAVGMVEWPSSLHERLCAPHLQLFRVSQSRVGRSLSVSGSGLARAALPRLPSPIVCRGRHPARHWSAKRGGGGKGMSRVLFGTLHCVTIDADLGFYANYRCKLDKFVGDSETSKSKYVQ